MRVPVDATPRKSAIAPAYTRRVGIASDIGTIDVVLMPATESARDVRNCGIEFVM
jgi:hypothetical protein